MGTFTGYDTGPLLQLSACSDTPTCLPCRRILTDIYSEHKRVCSLAGGICLPVYRNTDVQSPYPTGSRTPGEIPGVTLRKPR